MEATLRDSALAETLVDGDILQQAIREFGGRVQQLSNPERNAERRARRDTGHATQKLPVERKRVHKSTALRDPTTGEAYTLVGRLLIDVDGFLTTARRNWKAGELVHQVGLGKLDAAGKKAERLRNETAVHKRMRRPIRDTWLNGGMAKLMALAKIGGAYAPGAAA